MVELAGSLVVALPPGGQGQAVPGESHRITCPQFLGQVQGFLVQDRGRLEVPEKNVKVRNVDEQEGNLVAQPQVPDDAESLFIHGDGIFVGALAAGQQAQKLECHGLAPTGPRRPGSSPGPGGPRPRLARAGPR
jgi:hypothetical protein